MVSETKRGHGLVEPCISSKLSVRVCRWSVGMRHIWVLTEGAYEEIALKAGTAAVESFVKCSYSDV